MFHHLEPVVNIHTHADQNEINENSLLRSSDLGMEEAL